MHPSTHDTHTDAGTNTTAEVQAAFAAALARSRVGSSDDFFALGGDAALARETLRRLGRRFDLALPPSLLAELPTPAGLAGAIALLRDVCREPR